MAAILGPRREYSRKLREVVQLLESVVEEHSVYKRQKADDGLWTNGNSEFQIGSGNVQDLVAYAHRICYTTFAFPESSKRAALPPAPQDEQMRASQLYQHANLDVGIPRPQLALLKPPSPPPAHIPPQATQPQDKAPPALPRELPPMPPGWKPGDPLSLPPEVLQGMPMPSNLPPMPPGWKPGDPLPLPELPPMPPGWKPGDAIPLPPRPPAAPAGPPQEQHFVDFVQLDLNPDFSDYSDSDEEDESEDEDD